MARAKRVGQPRLATTLGRRVNDIGHEAGDDRSETDQLRADLHLIVDALQGCGRLLTMRDAGRYWLEEEAQTERMIQAEVSRRLLRFRPADAG